MLLCLFVRAGHAQQGKPEILWDTYGVPHVYAGSTADMYYAFGWAQMYNHGNLVLQLYGQARGRAAEYWGEGQLPLDRLIHLFNIPELARQHYAQQEPAFKACIDAFVKGVNAYAAAHPEAISPAMKQVLPVTAGDVMAHGLRLLYIQFLAPEDIEAALVLGSRGSNAIAIGPSRSADGNAMLVANPHLPWANLYLFFEAQLNAPGYHAYGVTLIGVPVLAIAFNNHLGWTHTVNPIDAVDRYELKMPDSSTYLLDNVKMHFRQRTVQLKVKQRDGSMQEQAVTLKYSEHGPVITGKNGRACAIRIAGMADHPHLMLQWHEMGKAVNRAQFEAALQRMQLPMFNVVYADDAGNISYLFAGNVPVRRHGDWEFWQQMVDGSKSAYIWQQTHPYRDLPRLLNPATGFVQNANDPPWTSTYPPLLRPEDYPPYMAPVYMYQRQQRAVNMLRSDSSITFDELVSYKLSTRMGAADRFLDDLLEAVRQYPDTAAVRAAAVLEQWDRMADAASTGTLLFAKWFDQLSESMYKIPWDPHNPVATPDGLKDPKAAVQLLAKAAAEMQADYGRLDVPWGQVARFRINGYDYAANGGPGHYGIFRVIDYHTGEDKKLTAVAGDSYVAIVSFGKKVKAKVLLSYGNATQPGSRHTGDQVPLLSRKELRTPWLQREEVLQHLEKKETL